MKKAVTLLAVALALAAAFFFTTRKTGRGGREFSIERAAELAPADATFFWAMPDLERTKARWKGSELLPFAGPAETGEAPAGYGMVEGLLVPQPGGFLRELMSPVFMVWGRKPTELENMQTSALWIAAKEVHVANPKVMIALRTRGKKSDVEAAINHLKERFLAVRPGVKSELSRAYGIEMETLHSVALGPNDPPPLWEAPEVLCIAFRDGWVFLATDRALLAGALGRYMGAANAGQSLAEMPWFAEGRRQALPEADFCAWSRWGWSGPMVEGDLGEMDAGWKPDLSEVTVVQVEGRVDGATQGRVYVQLTELPPLEMGESACEARAIAWGYALAGDPIARRWMAATPLERVFGEERPYLDIDFDELPREAYGWMGGGRCEVRPAMLSRPTGGSLAEIGGVLGPDLTLVAVDRGVRETGFMMAVELGGMAEAFRMGEVIHQAQRPAGIEEWRGLWDLAFGERRRMRGPAGVAGARVRFEFSAGAEGSAAGEARFYVEAPELFEAGEPGIFEMGKIRLPWLSLDYKPWLQASGAKAVEPRVPGPIRVRKDGRNWIVESDLNVLGFSLLQEMGEHRP